MSDSGGPGGVASEPDAGTGGGAPCAADPRTASRHARPATRPAPTTALRPRALMARSSLRTADLSASPAVARGKGRLGRLGRVEGPFHFLGEVADEGDLAQHLLRLIVEADLLRRARGRRGIGR